MIHTSNTSAAPAVARRLSHAVNHAILKTAGWVVEITLLDREGIAIDLRYISQHDDLMTLYTPIRMEAEPMPHKKAKDASDFVRNCYDKLFPGTDCVSVRLIKASKVAKRSRRAV